MAEDLDAARPRDPVGRAEHDSPSRDVRLAWLLIACGLIGLIAAFTVTVEKFALVADPTYVPSCSINPVLSCGSVMSSAQAAVFGFPNPLLGIVGFTAVSVTGAALVGRVTLPGWYRYGLQAGVTFGVLFVHWLAFQSLYRIGALCPYCLVVWAVTIPTFWYVTLDNLRTGAQRGIFARPVAWARQFHSVILTVWVLAFVVAIAVRFWSSWVLLW